MTSESKKAVVVGAGSGIGRGTAIALGKAGYRVIAADLNLDAARETARTIGADAEAFAVDARDPASLDALAAAVDESGAIDVWVNSAGIGIAAPLLEITPDYYERIRQVNLDGTLWGCQAAARRMIPRKRGCIVNISSNAADQPMPTLSVYALTKAGVNMLTRSLAIELGKHGIRVNAVAPGFIVTEMTVKPTLTPEEREAVIERNASRSPLHLVGAPEDIASAVVYLASDSARYITGHIMRVNGGAAMPG